MSQRLRDYVPALRYGAKIYPNDIAGLVGLPHVGNIYYVDPSGGSDTANSGSAQDNALKTVAEAHDKTTGSNHDVIVIAPSGGTGRTSEDSAITWNKRFTHLVGNAAPTIQDARAGMSFATGGSMVHSENGCIWKNITLFSSADIDETVSVSGDYNAFIGVDFKGTSNATSADSNPWRALNLNGAQENSFFGCTFGGDTYTRGGASATLEFENVCSRNWFEDCMFTMHADTAETQLHVLYTGSNAVDRWTMFKNCYFYAFYTNHTAKVDAVFDLTDQTATTDVFMPGSLASGFDDWEAAESSGAKLMHFEQKVDTTPGVFAGLTIQNDTTA